MRRPTRLAAARRRPRRRDPRQRRPAGPAAHAQAVYGSIAGTVTDSTAPPCPGVDRHGHQRRAEDRRHRGDQRAPGLYVKERLLPGTYR